MNAKVSATAYDDGDKAEKISSAQSVASIDDLLIQIFLSIPLKPLFRFKLVSKHWNFIISDKNFNFLRNQNPNPAAVGLIFLVSVGWACPQSSYVVSFDKPTNCGPLFREIKINSQWPCETLDSCNGLLLCKHKQSYCVCNPTTNKHFTLPIRDDQPFWTRYLNNWMYLAFDPSRSPHYKVVSVTTMFVLLQGWYNGTQLQLEVYSSETGCWRKHSCEPFSDGVDFNRGVYWNGPIHWISRTSTEESLYFNPDYNDQVPQVMPTPPMITQLSKLINPQDWSCGYRYFGESCGHLHYIDDDKVVTELSVYEMRTDYSEWFLKYRVDCSLIDINIRLDSILCALIRGKKGEDSFLVWESEKRIIRYNLVYKTCETILEKLDEDSARICPTWKHPMQYIESLSYV